MPTHPIATSLRRQHLTCDLLFDELLARVESGEYRECDSIWDRFAETLEEHMRFEEVRILPHLEVTVSGQEVAGKVRADHAHIRGVLSSMGIAVQLHELRMDAAAQFIAELRAHAAFENQALYPWADVMPPLHDDHTELLHAALAAGGTAGALVGLSAGPLGAVTGAAIGVALGAVVSVGLPPREEGA